MTEACSQDERVALLNGSTSAGSQGEFSLVGSVVSRRYHGKSLTFANIASRNGLLRRSSATEDDNANANSPVEDMKERGESVPIDDDLQVITVCFDKKYFAPQPDGRPFPNEKSSLRHGDKLELSLITAEEKDRDGKKRLAVKSWELISRLNLQKEDDAPGKSAADPASAETKSTPYQSTEAYARTCATILPSLSPESCTRRWLSMTTQLAALAASPLLSLAGVPKNLQIRSLAWLGGVSVLATSLLHLWKRKAYRKVVLTMSSIAEESSVSAEQLRSGQRLHRLFVTVPSGFQDVAAEEVIEKLHATEVVTLEGKVVFSIAESSLAKISTLRCAEKFFAFVADVRDLPSGRGILEQLRLPLWSALGEVNMKPALHTWYRYQTANNLWVEQRKSLSFRVNAKLGGRVLVTQNDVGRSLAEGLAEVFGLLPLMKNFSLEVYAHLHFNPPYRSGSLLLGLALPGADQIAYRETGRAIGGGITSSGRELSATSLRPTIAFGLLRVAKVAKGDIVMDPMSGCGTIPELGTIHFPDAFFIAGDKYDVAINKTKRNLARLENAKYDIVQWDSERLPLRRNCIDVVVTDMPFGKRMGSHFRNNRMYPNTLAQFSRVVSKPAGRTVILTTEKKVVYRQVHRNRTWILHRQSTVTVGGLNAKCFHITYL